MKNLHIKQVFPNEKVAIIMELKTRMDFKTDQEYYQYANTEEFLVNYSIKNKTLVQVMNDLVIPNDWLDQAKVVYKSQLEDEEFAGIHFALKLDNLVIQLEDYYEELSELNENRSGLL